MTTVLATTEQVPELAALIERRRTEGLDTFDEWWEGVYRIVTGPTPEHGELVLALGGFLAEVAARQGLRVAAPVNVGRDKVDARVPDLGVYRPDTVRTSPAFLSTAVLVAEILSPGELAGQKLPFYARWGVEEYLEVDPTPRPPRLLARRDAGWEPVERSSVGFRLEGADLVDDQTGRRLALP